MWTFRAERNIKLFDAVCLFVKFKLFTFLRLEADSNLCAPNVLCRS